MIVQNYLKPTTGKESCFIFTMEQLPPLFLKSDINFYFFYIDLEAFPHGTRALMGLLEINQLIN